MVGVFYLPEDLSRAPDGICLAHNRPLLYVIRCQPISGWDSPLRWFIKKKYKINLIIRNIVLSLYCNQNINTMSKYQVLSPDGFTIEREPSYYTSKKKAMESFLKWKENYQRQGYYSSTKYGRIHLSDLGEYCQFIKL